MVRSIAAWHTSDAASRGMRSKHSVALMHTHSIFNCAIEPLLFQSSVSQYPSTFQSSEPPKPQPVTFRCIR